MVEKLCEYLQYKSTYENVSAKEDIPDFTERVPPEIVLELYVNCAILELSSHTVVIVYLLQTTSKVSIAVPARISATDGIR